MKKKPLIMSPVTMISRSAQAKIRIRDIVKLAKKLTEDTFKDERMTKYECKACFYIHRMAGQAVTHQPCMSCGEEIMYSNTNTDALCSLCAKKHELCKHCGGDIKMRERRKEWPNTIIDV